ncbi:ankyrin [Karstenula rhodostoma CBS 690.94]|uniref:Ankyrin n=1 Tax=Karstenula rhodostoma CBS 690.94 TaxID=1392251 RepID=A0A9P4UFS1_9PLEO|nr:ankyrin [Karstenula rhodostoma CBS 690.94]
MARLYTAKELDLFDMEVPEGMSISCIPPAQEHMEDPFWYDQGGRNPFYRKRVHKISAGAERKAKLSEILEEFPRYGPAMHEWAVDQNDPNLLRELFELKVSLDIKKAKRKDDDENEEDEMDYSYPQVDMQPALHVAAFDGKLECVKVIIEVGHADINTKDDRDTTPLTNALVSGHEDVVDWLLEHGANIIFEANPLNDIHAAMRSGNVAMVKKVLEHPQAVERKLCIEVSDLRWAAQSRGGRDPRDMIQFVLQFSCFGPPVNQSQKDAIVESLAPVVSLASIESVRLMLPFLTKQKDDGSFEYLELPEDEQANIFNSTEDAMEKRDIPELFKLVWETLLSGSTKIPDKNNELTVTNKDRLNRRLISACAEGCAETCRLLVDQYGADIHHVSHKYSTTPLGRAAGSSANPIERRLPVARYLLEEKHANIHLADGEFANSSTPLGMLLKSGTKGQDEMVKLLLKHGGPVEAIGDDVLPVVEEAEAGAKVELYLVLYQVPREPVKLMTQRQTDGYRQVKVEASREEWKTWLGSMQIRKSDEVLAAEDPKGRALERIPAC